MCAVYKIQGYSENDVFILHLSSFCTTMTRSQNKSPQKRSRKPQRCTKCEDRPLRSECEHSASGLRFLAAKAHQEVCLSVMNIIKCWQRIMTDGSNSTQKVSTIRPSSFGYSVSQYSSRHPWPETGPTVQQKDCACYRGSLYPFRALSKT